MFLEENANVDLEMVVLAADAAFDKFSLMVSSGEELPDVVNLAFSMTDLSYYGSMGVFVPLNSYYEDSSFYIKSLLIENEIDYYMSGITSSYNFV